MRHRGFSGLGGFGMSYGGPGFSMMPCPHCGGFLVKNEKGDVICTKCNAVIVPHVEDKKAEASK